jgi:hypothetical protein
MMGWQAPWYSVPEQSLDSLVAGRAFGLKACYLRRGDRVFETYWTTGRGGHTSQAVTTTTWEPPNPPATGTAATDLSVDRVLSRLVTAGWATVWSPRLSAVRGAS